MNQAQNNVLLSEKSHCACPELGLNNSTVNGSREGSQAAAFAALTADLISRSALSWSLSLAVVAPHVLPQVAQGTSPRPGPLPPGVSSSAPHCCAAHIHLDRDGT